MFLIRSLNAAFLQSYWSCVLWWAFLPVRKRRKKNEKEKKKKTKVENKYIFSFSWISWNGFFLLIGEDVWFEVERNENPLQLKARVKGISYSMLFAWIDFHRVISAIDRENHIVHKICILAKRFSGCLSSNL